MPFNGAPHLKLDRTASPGTDDSSTKLTPSSRSSRSSDGVPIASGSNSYELRTIAPRGEPEPKHEHEDDDDDDEFQSSIRRPSLDSVQSYELYTPDEDRAVLKKLDRRLVLFMALLYCLSFLDRSSKCVEACEVMHPMPSNRDSSYPLFELCMMADCRF